MDIAQEQKYNMRFVKTVQKYPVLYNTDLKENAKRECRERAWIEVAEELNCDPQEAKRKWKNFRSILLRNVKKLQMGESVPKYYLYDHMKYLIPHIKKTFEPGTLKRTLVEPSPATAEYETGSDRSIENIELVEDVAEHSHDPIYLENYEPFERPVPKKNRFVSSEDEAGSVVDDDLTSNPRRNEFTEYITFTDKVTNSTPQPAQYTGQLVQAVSSDSPKRQFVLSLLPDVNEMSNSQMRQFKCKVVQLIDEILNENNT